MELKRLHIFKDILGDGSSAYHSAILTSFSFDPLFYANFFKPQLCARGIVNQVVLIDSSRLDEAIENERYSYLPGISPFEGYTPLRIECSSDGVFHPKIGFFIGRKRITAIVGSGNLTYSGMSYNDEAWCAFSISSADSQDVTVVAAIWAYLKSVIARQEVSSVSMQLSWMYENSELLHDIDSIDYYFTENLNSKGERFVFVANSEAGTIFDQMEDVIGGASVSRITICAPFFDTKGIALENLIRSFSPLRIDCLVHPGEGVLPIGLDLNSYPNINFYEFDIDGEKRKASVHAKLIQVETDRGTTVAVGSANLSFQALGRNGYYSNDEADILIINSEKRDYLKELGISYGKKLKDLSDYRQEEKKDDVKLSRMEITIRSSELLEDGLHLFIDGGSQLNVEFHIVDDFRKETVIFANSLAEGETILPLEKIKSARMVFVTRNEERISNKCVILIRSEIEKKNPDRITASIGNLLENAKTGEEFEDLLKNVHIEEESHSKMRVHASSSVESGPKELSNKVIADEDFENKVFRNRITTYEKVNDQILDRLASLILSAEDDFDYTERSQDEVMDQNLIDQGLPEDENLEESGINNKGGEDKKKSKVLTVMDEARGYFKRLIKFYLST